MRGALRVVALILLGLGVVGFGLMSLCSGLFLIVAGKEFFVVALVCLLVFGPLLALCIWGVRTVLGKDPDKE